jgi:hypothetical protein
MKITNKHNLPAPFVALLSKDFYSKGASQYSVTELMSPPKIRRMREQYDEEIEVDATELIASQLGTFMHGKLEGKAVEGYTNEERIFHSIDGITISGQIDIQEQTKDGIVIADYKFVKVWSIIQHLSGKKDDWHVQLNIYKWLVETVKKQKVCGLQVCAVGKDWSARGVTQEHYPQAPAVMIDIPMWDSVTTETYVRQRLNLHRVAKQAQEFGEELEPCTDKDRWINDTIYAVKREGRKTAIRVLKTIEEATELAEKEKGYVEERKGEPVRCAGNFCGVSKWCKQYQGEINVTA